MKKMIAVLAAALALTACTSVKPDAGQECVLIQKPLIFGHGGVDDTAVKTGRTFVALTTDEVCVDVKPTEWSVPFEDLMTKDGVPMHFDASVSVQVVDSVRLIRDFGPKWFELNVESVFRNLVRQSVRKYGMNEVAIDTTAIDAIDKEIHAGLEAYIAKTNLPVKLIRTTVGKANAPDQVKNQRINTAQEEQRQKTEAMTQAAEVARKQAEMARAEADNAYRSQMGLSPQQFVELERNKMLRETCGDGKCTFVIGNAAALVQAK